VTGVRLGLHYEHLLEIQGRSSMSFFVALLLTFGFVLLTYELM